MKFFKIVTPLTIVLVLLIIAIVDSYISLEESGGWSGIGLIVGIPIAIAVFFTDFFTRVHFKDDVKKIWMYESIIVVVLLIFLLVMVGMY
jgi:hypothetical protein